MAADVRVAIVGGGVIGPGSTGMAGLREQLRSGRSAATDVSRFDTSIFRSHKAALIDDFDAKQFIPAAKMRRMNQLSRFVVASARLAFEDAGGAESFSGLEQGGVAIGTMFGPVETSVKYLDEYRDKGPALAPPQLFAESVANAPGSHVAIQYGLKGFNLTFTQRESSAMTALVAAAMQIAKGAAPLAIAGGVDEINEITYGIYDRLGALARERDGHDEAPRPFDRNRDGLCLGEGGAAFILAAEAGGREPYGWVAGFAQGRDQTAGLSDWGRDGSAVARVMRHAIEDAGISLSQVDAVFASANGNRKGDAVEASGLRELFGSSVPPVVATKGSFGEYAAGGGLQIAAALLALRHGELYPSSGFYDTDPDLALPVTSDHSERELGYVLVNSLSAGGGIVSVVLASQDTDR